MKGAMMMMVMVTVTAIQGPAVVMVTGIVIVIGVMAI